MCIYIIYSVHIYYICVYISYIIYVYIYIIYMYKTSDYNGNGPCVSNFSNLMGCKQYRTFRSILPALSWTLSFNRPFSAPSNSELSSFSRCK